MNEMRKNTLLAVSTEDTVNIGDYIQALASSQFYPSVDGFVQREELDECSEPVKMIMNGWYMHHPEHWPPSDCIEPLFVAFHINSVARKELLSEESVAYLKRHEPIGCRDVQTQKMLERKGVDAYFSACMTLTLGYRYHDDVKDGGIYFVDPIVEFKNQYDKFIELIRSLSRIRIVAKLAGKSQDGSLIHRMMWYGKFYRLYRSVFSQELLLEAEYFTQASEGFLKEYETEEERLMVAENLIKKYSKAECVVTSRIHCGLPCLGLETPVILLQRKDDEETSSCRMSGLQELFHTIEVGRDSVVPRFEWDGQPIGKYNFPANNNVWKQYANQLITKCCQFFDRWTK